MVKYRSATLNMEAKKEQSSWLDRSCSVLIRKRRCWALILVAVVLILWMTSGKEQSGLENEKWEQLDPINMESERLKQFVMDEYCKRIASSSPPPQGSRGTDEINIDEFMYTSEFKEHVVKGRNIANQNNTVLVTIINDAFLSMMYNWLCNTQDMGIHPQVLVITVDEESGRKLRSDWQAISVVTIRLQENLSGVQLFSHVGYVKLMVDRTQWILDLLSDGIEILLFEPDSLWVKNPLPELQKYPDHDIVVTAVSDRPRVVGGGFLYIKPTYRSRELWLKLSRQMTALYSRIKSLPSSRKMAEENDQNMLSELLFTKYRNIKFKILPFEKIPDGKWYTLPKQERSLSRPLVINNNWLIGTNAKITRAKTFGQWFINYQNVCSRRKVALLLDMFREKTS